MSAKKKPDPSANKSISINGDVKDSAVIIGDNNTTFFQKIVNICKSDSETLEQRNRRILLGHVENAWIKGVLDASLHGAALLDLGIKQDPEAVTKYPWAIKKESTDETLPAGTSMLEIFDSIGMGRSLLILGAPGSGKTTMLLELARQLIQHARQDVTYPIPMVFNLSSWTESKNLADWLAQELNNLYSVPRKTAPDWVKGDKLLLLLDGLDEVRQESRAKCVEAINAFRKEHGLTSLAVCSRSQDYADLNAKLSFEGAIEVRPLTQEQITKFFSRFGIEMTGIKQVLKKDSALREMAETPLFLSIMIMAYWDKQDVEILVSGDEQARRKHLFDTYIERMFERRPENTTFKKQDTLHWLSLLASRMAEHNQIPYLLENMQPSWLNRKKHGLFGLINGLIFGLIGGLFFGLFLELTTGDGGWIFVLFFGFLGGLNGGLFYRFANNKTADWKKVLSIGLFDLFAGFCIGLILGSDLLIPLALGVISGLFGGLFGGLSAVSYEIKMVDGITWAWRKGLSGGLIGGAIGIVVFGLYGGTMLAIGATLPGKLLAVLMFGLTLGPFVGLIGWVVGGFGAKSLGQTIYPGQSIIFSLRNFFFVFLLSGLLSGFIMCLILGLFSGLWEFPFDTPLFFSLIYLGLFLLGPIFGAKFGGLAVIGHYVLRFVIAFDKSTPWRLVPFLNHCVDLIFLRRVGGGYIFVHRLLMEHFAEMYVKTPTSKGNQK